MAISINLEDSQYGIPFSGAYFRIASAAVSRRRSGDNMKFSVMIDVPGYATMPEDDTRDVDFRRYHAPLDEVEACAGATFLERCYAWVMAQPDMAGAQAA